MKLKLSQMQKKWAVGGGIGAAALLVGYKLFHGRPAFAAPALPAGRPHEKRGHAHDRRKRRRDDHENGRGQYGRKKRRHGGHDHD